MNTAIGQSISENQQPLFTGFKAGVTSTDVMKGIDWHGKTAIVTGGYSGIGLETVKRLHQAGATVIVPTRNVAATREIFKEYTTRLEIAFMDLLAPESIDRFANEFTSLNRPLHLLVNNAGIMANPLTRDARGYESQFATNHLGHFQLSHRLWKALQKANGARVVNVSSLGHRYSNIRYDDPNFIATPYDRWIAYGQSKTANILFSLLLDVWGKADGIRAYSLHPGRILDTNLKKYLSQNDLIKAGVMDADGNMKNDKDAHLKSIEQGAATTLFCATSLLLNNIGGVYCEDVNIAPLVNEDEDISKMSKGVLSYAVDYDNAVRLWELSSKLTNLTWA